jgi:broad specificity phosphatase PhoE
MSTLFVFVRHAQGYHNLDGDQRGEEAYYDPIHIDAELTKYGILQAKNNNLGNETFDAIYVSPMKRCVQTLLNIYPPSQNLQVNVDDRIIEQPQGKYLCNKRVDKSELVNTLPSKWNTEKVYNKNPHILNSSIDEYKLESFTKYIKEKHPNSKVLIVTHGIWIRNWLLRYKYQSRHINNCEVLREIL